MQTKLTLRLEDDLILQAKIFAKASGKSVSQIVADYFALLTEEKADENIRLTPIVRSLKGALCGANIDIEDYHDYLEDKYL